MGSMIFLFLSCCLLFIIISFCQQVQWQIWLVGSTGNLKPTSSSCRMSGRDGWGWTRVVLYPDKPTLHWASGAALSGLNKAKMHTHTHTHQCRRSSCLLMLCASEPWSRRYRIGGKWDRRTTRKLEREVRDGVVFVCPLCCPMAPGASVYCWGEMRTAEIQLNWYLMPHCAYKRTHIYG